jgi:hypothetical protein
VFKALKEICKLLMWCISQRLLLYPPSLNLLCVGQCLKSLGIRPQSGLIVCCMQLPTDPDAFDAELRKVGIPPVPRKGPRKRIARPPKEKVKKQRFRINKLTNVHMPELFRDATIPASID